MKKVGILFLILTMAAFPGFAQEQGSVSQEAEDALQETEDALQAAGEEVEQETEELAQEAEQAAEEAEQELGVGEEYEDIPAPAEMMGTRARASILLGYPVIDEAGEAVGTIENLVITADGKVPYAVIAFDVTGFGEESVLIPLGSLDFAEGLLARAVRITMDAAQLDMESAPILEDDELDAFEPGWDRDVRDYWGEYLPQEDFVEADEDIKLPESGKRAFLASELLDYEIANYEEEELGEVDDIMLNIDDKEVAYLAVSTGGFLGIGEDTYAIAISTFEINDEEENLLLSVTEDTFEEAEGFGGEPWPEDADPYWNNFVTD